MHQLKRILIGVLAVTTIASSAHAQAIYGAAEADTDDMTFFLLGASISAPGMGWKPYVALSTYHLRFDAGAASVTRNVIAPSVGLVNRGSEGSLQFGVGYSFADKDVTAPFPVAAESGDGVFTSAQWNHWGDGSHAYQLMGSYNWGTEFLWTRGRAAWQLAPQSPLFVGGEAAVLGGGDPSAWLAQVGPTVEWRFSPQLRLGLSAGVKFGLSNYDNNPAYGRVEFLWLPSTR